MAPETPPKNPPAQRLYGGVVYWITILSAILCMIGPVIAMASPENNVLNPHFLFARIFDGEKPMSVWALGASEPVKLAVWTEGPDGRTEHGELVPLEAVERLRSLPRPAAGAPRAVFGIGDELRIVRLPESEVEERAEYFLNGDDRKAGFEKAREGVLATYGHHVFTNGHFWTENPTSGDGFTQIGLALGCSVAFWALIGAAFLYLREKNILYAGLAIWVALLVFLSASGIVAQGH